ncbi:VOC family protein [Polyangium sp. y55x31]|uniref:4-hydroxyphenylpyruvate dioxygenase family protein n=1 Tax=Polyangium sp. y55x31 TaxID=3042688 RepID=UPI002483299E|nr:VOC family protein [Polyangium sp. y55x31]MDI1484130.1 VOC family protein [Polyangium sp. y55x31]
MSKVESIGIKRIEALHYYVRDLERSRKFYTEKLDFEEIAHSSPDLEEAAKQRSVVFRAGECIVMCSQPLGEGGRAWRYLRKHPDGVGTLIFEVEDIERAFRLLDGRGGTPIDEITRVKEDGGEFASFSITSPFGDTTFRFVERKNYRKLFPGAVHYDIPRGGKNTLGFTHFDHITTNFQTMAPALLWMEHVLGFERFWEIQFHTEDVKKGGDHGSGLRSAVMWDPGSGVKFANNEPYRPYFKSSQINIFNEEHRGDGVQHAAIAVKDILTSVKHMRERGIQFMPTPGSYYDALPARLKSLGVQQIDEDVNVLRDLEILVDGEAEGKYLLQIFLKESAGTHGDPDAGPFFYEIIQRKGDRGFGGGNFRALFESIERQQKTEGKVA